IEKPEEVLGKYDVVFAKGRAALEALACGCSVVVCDERGLGPMVNTENFEETRAENFGFPLMTELNEPAKILDRLKTYDAVDSAAVTAKVRETCGLQHTADALEALYVEA